MEAGKFLGSYQRDMMSSWIKIETGWWRMERVVQWYSGALIYACPVSLIRLEIFYILVLVSSLINSIHTV